jgi:hypothetical protein
LPSDSDVNAIVGPNANDADGNPYVAAAFDFPHTYFGALTLGGKRTTGPSGAGTSEQYHTAATYNLDLTNVPNKLFLVVGLLDPVTSGSGFSSLHFRMNTGSNVTLIDQTFINVSDATTYFDDHPINLGFITDFGNNLTLNFLMDVTSNQDNSGFSTDLVFGNAVPEPCVAPLVSLASAALSRRRRRRG